MPSMNPPSPSPMTKAGAFGGAVVARMRRGYPAGGALPVQPRTDELGDAGDALADLRKAALLERLDDLVTLEHPHAALAADDRLPRAHRCRAAAARCEDRDPPARSEHAHD